MFLKLVTIQRLYRNSIGTIKSADTNMKDWIKDNNENKIVNTVMSLHWSETPMADIIPPRFFSESKANICPLDTDPTIALNIHCIADPNGWLSVDDANEIVLN